MIKHFWILLVAVYLQGCAVPQIEPTQRITFPVSEYNSLNREGTGIVNGQAFLKTRGGDVKTAAGEEVLLNPVTSYSNQWYKVAYTGNKPITEPDPRYWNYVRKEIADADGRFTFKNVPPGDYYLTTTVYWEAPVGYHGALVRQGGLISRKITVVNDETLDVILTR
jgi:hypothetical protein